VAPANRVVNVSPMEIRPVIGVGGRSLKIADGPDMGPFGVLGLGGGLLRPLASLLGLVALALLPGLARLLGG